MYSSCTNHTAPCPTRARRPPRLGPHSSMSRPLSSERRHEWRPGTTVSCVRSEQAKSTQKDCVHEMRGWTMGGDAPPGPAPPHGSRHLFLPSRPNVDATLYGPRRWDRRRVAFYGPCSVCLSTYTRPHASQESRHAHTRTPKAMWCSDDALGYASVTDPPNPTLLEVRKGPCVLPETQAIWAHHCAPRHTTPMDRTAACPAARAHAP